MAEPTWVRLSKVERRSIVWLDRPFLQRAAFILLTGKKGSAKGTYLCGLAAKVTRGELLDSHGNVLPRNVLVISSEDSAAIDIGPRVDAADGDSARIHVRIADFRLPRDIDALKQFALEIGEVGLIVIDPLGNHLMDTKTDPEGPVRNAIAPLNPLADELDCLLMGVRHLGKDSSRGALASVLGATAWVDVPRAVIVMAADDEDDFVFHAQVVAGNRGPRGGAGRAYRLELVDVGLDEPVTYLRATGESNKDVEDLLALRPTTSRSAEARELILDLLDGIESMESDALDARVVAETDLKAKTVQNLRGKLKDEGLIRVRPEKDADGKVLRWHVYRTSAPRESRDLDQPDPDSENSPPTNGLNRPDPSQLSRHSDTGPGLLREEPDPDSLCTGTSRDVDAGERGPK